jgi:hypothetical protein
MNAPRRNAIVYERAGPVSDMFVPHVATIAPVERTSRRVSGIVLAALMVSAIPVFVVPGGTASFFSDQEQSTGNTFGAAPLGIVVAADHTSATLVAGAAGETFVITPSPATSSLPFSYEINAVTSGSAPFCKAIIASAGAPVPYSGPASFSAGPTTTLASWPLTLALPANSPGVVDGQICILDLSYDAYQLGGVPGTEFHDTAHVILTLTADPPIIVPLTQAASLSNVSDAPAADAGTTAPPPVTEPPVSNNADPAPSDTGSPAPSTNGSANIAGGQVDAPPSATPLPTDTPAPESNTPLTNPAT